jgi:hypothetical protein
MITKFIAIIIITICFISGFVLDRVSAAPDNIKDTIRELKFTPTPFDSITNKVFVDADSNKYPVYRGKNGGLYIWKTSQKTGKKYRYYPKILYQYKQ